MHKESPQKIPLQLIFSVLPDIESRNSKGFLNFKIQMLYVFPVHGSKILRILKSENMCNFRILRYKNMRNFQI